MLRVVLFDLDGTLVDTERENAEGLRRALARLGHAMSEEEIDFVVGHSWVDIYALLCARHGPSLPPLERLVEQAAAEREVVLRFQGITVMPGAREALARLGARWPLALVSGSSRREAAFVLDGLGLTEQFRVILTAEDYTPGKPSPRGYLLAAERLAAAPADCLVVEDSTAGIVAGRDAGMRVVAVKSGNFARQDQSRADVVVDTLDELDDALLARLFPPGLPAGATKLE